MIFGASLIVIGGIVMFLIGKRALKEFGWQTLLIVVVLSALIGNASRCNRVEVEPSFPRPTGNSDWDEFRKSQWDDIKKGLNP